MEALGPLFTNFTSNVNVTSAENNRTCVTTNGSSCNNSQYLDDYFYDYDHYDSNVDKLIDALNLYAIPVIIVAGLLGNSLSFVIFTTTQLRLLSSSVYLAFMNVVDSVFLLTLFLGNWLNYVGIPVLHKNGCCQITVYLSYVSAFLSVYTVVCFTVERAIVVFKPFHRAWCSAKRAKCVVLLLLVLGLVLYSFAVWTHKIVAFYVGHPQVLHTTCYWDEKYITVLKILISVDTFLTLLVPSVIIGVLNFAIAAKIYRVIINRRRHLICSAERKSFLKEYVFGHRSTSEASNDSYTMHLAVAVTETTKQRAPSVTSHSSTNPRPGRGDVSNVLQLRTTRTLLLVSSVFVLLNLPSHSIKIYVFVAQHLDSNFHPPISLLRWQELAQFLYYVNFSANFFLYCAFSVAFRCALKRSFFKLKARILSKLRRNRRQARDDLL